MALLEFNWHPTNKQLRMFAWLLVVFAAVIGLSVYLRTEMIVVPAMIFATVVLVAGIGLLFPRLLRAIFVTWMLLAFPIGWLISHIMMGIVYYFIFTPVGLTMRLFGRDPLQRRFDPTASTYWKARSEKRKLDRYFRQF